ncbi:hypothetical protein [Larkinella insperata]
MKQGLVQREAKPEMLLLPDWQTNEWAFFHVCDFNLAAQLFFLKV